MSEFLQLHLLTSYPPANLNRDDMGRPKSALFGGTQRLRVSSQSLKRAWRTAAPFSGAGLSDLLGVRTRSMGEEIFRTMTGRGATEKDADEFAKRIAGVFGKLPDKPRDEREGRKLRQLAHFSALERAAIDRIVERRLAGEEIPEGEIEALLSDGRGSVDVALFGRMLADDPGRNVDAAAQVAHALTVHKVAIEDDYFTAVDDLNRRDEDSGAGHVNVSEFGAGVFYVYCCVNRSLLAENLNGDQALTSRAVRALTEAATTTPPGGKINSYGSYAYASYVLAERGENQPRNLSVAFLGDLRPSPDGDFVVKAREALESTRDQFDRAYGKNADSDYVLDVKGGRGSLDELLSFVARPRG